MHCHLSAAVLACSLLLSSCFLDTVRPSTLVPAKQPKIIDATYEYQWDPIDAESLPDVAEVKDAFHIWDVKRDDTGDTVGCHLLSPDLCDVTEGCHAILAMPMLGWGDCGSPDRPEPEYLGCTNTQPCLALAMCTTNPATQAKYIIEGACGPAGWPVEVKDGHANNCCKSDCKETAAGGFCIRGMIMPSGERLNAEDAVNVDVYPKGCHHEACRKTIRAICQLDGEYGRTTITPHFCFEDGSHGEHCPATCPSGAFASCHGMGGGSWPDGDNPWKYNGAWVAGKNIVRMGDLSLEVDVPVMLPPGGLCTGTDVPQ